VRARNSNGFSDYSQEVEIIAASKPEAPSVVSSANVNSDILITWSDPDNNGLAITSYTIVLQKSDFTFATELMYCNGATSLIVSSRSCSIPLS